MRQVWFIAISDAWYQLRQGSTLLWALVMPPIFFYFIGSMTSGFSSSVGGATATPIVVIAESPGFLQEQIDLRLVENDFAPEWVEQIPENDPERPVRRSLEISTNLSEQILAGETVTILFDTKSSAMSRDFETIRVQRSLYTALADVVVADTLSEGQLSAADLVRLNGKERVWQLDVSPAGQRQKIPSGFEQAIPGILVMFTLLILLTTGGSMLIIERKQGLLRRLASAPLSRSEIVAGKWGGRMLLAIIQVGIALLFGTFLFKMIWGPDFAMVLIVLAAWAGFCASAGLLLGSLANTEGQASGLGVLAANLLAALGGCWWPIEITPPWMQALQQLLPTGWTMDALHKLISFQSGPWSALPEIALLLVATAIVGGLAVSRFRFQ